MDLGRPPLSSGALDRDAVTRADPEALRAAWADPGSRLLVIDGVSIPLDAQAETPRLLLLPTSGDFTAEDAEGRVHHVYLGRLDGAPRFAVPRGALDLEAADWVHPFEVGDRLDPTEREMLAVASALFHWHDSARYSPRDGEETVAALAGWARRDAHGGEHFPRTDPAVIVLIEHEDRVLLGSNALWEEGRFSLLAGFVEAGESLEQTVVREVFEEAGVRVAEPSYVASQPWPFPRSLMVGFRAPLAEGQDPDALVADPQEISELRWFTREELRNPAPGIILPMPLSIARWMIDRWIAEDDRERGR